MSTTFKRINTTPEQLKAAAGGEIALFDTLTLVNTSILGGKAHVYRKPMVGTFKNDDVWL